MIPSRIFFFLIFIYLLLSVLGLLCYARALSSDASRAAHRCTAWAFYRSGFSRGDSSCSSLGFRTWASAAEAHGLRWPKVCEIFLDQESNPCALHWQVNSYSLYHQRSALLGVLFIYFQHDI